MTGRARPGAGLRVAVAMFTLLPVPRSWHEDDVGRSARSSVAWLPLLGAALGAGAGLLAAAVLARAPGAGVLAAAIGVAALAVLTRGLHLDGLADTADGLGSRAPAERALEIMRRSDIGPFGVVTVVLVLLVDIAAFGQLIDGGTWRAVAALTVAAATGRLAVVHAALPSIAPAPGSGFGALVAGGTSPAGAAALTVLVLGGGAALAAGAGASPLGWPLAQAVALVLAAAFRAHTSRRFGGVSGDVFGALVEITTALTLVGLVLTVR